MVKKSKYNLSTYFLEENLLFYTSLNKKKKKIAFSILQVKDCVPIITILNNFLKKEYLNYYSIQISLLNNYKTLIFMVFIDFEKNRILNSFNIIREKLSEINDKVIFLKEESLEKQFFSIGFSDVDSKFNRLKSKEVITIENDRSRHLLSFSTLDLFGLTEKETFLHDFYGFLKKRELKGFLILIFKKTLSDEISVFNYFVELKEIDEKVTNLRDEINDFFNFPLIKKQKLELKNLFKLLFRLEMSEERLAFREVSKLFYNKEMEKKPDLAKLNLKLEDIFKTNEINFHRLNPNLILINNKILFVLFEKVDFELLNKVIANYYNKYQIFILILNRQDYYQLIEFEKINELKQLKVFNYQEDANSFLDKFIECVN